MGFWRIVDLLMGPASIAMGLFSIEFKPVGWTTRLIWGGENTRIPRWIAGSFYVVLGLFLLYIGFTDK